MIQCGEGTRRVAAYLVARPRASRRDILRDFVGYVPKRPNFRGVSQLNAHKVKTAYSLVNRHLQHALRCKVCAGKGGA